VTAERQPIISVRNLAKAYTLYERPRDILLEALFGGVRHDIFWALKDVSFDVHEGDRVGIVGPNGAGKSTLLQLVTGNLTPTSGTVEVRGAVSAMLSLTSFLDPNETGLENIRFNLLLNGVDSKDAPRLTEEVVDFAELGGFVHAPVRTYSSGMNARLAFSIATVVTPDVLVVDEVLGVGDAYFASKAMLRMVELCREGRALLFVSHAASAVQLICNKAIWLDSGGVRAIGPVDEIVKAYEDDFRREEDERVRQGNIERRRALERRVRPEEISGSGDVRVRLIGEGGRLTDTHYVRRIAVAAGDPQPHDVSLYVDAVDDDGAPAQLDLVHSEWGRIHSRRGSDSRALAPAARLLRGGHVLIRPPRAGNDAVDVTVEVESTSVGGSEVLALQVADAATGDWLPVERVASRRLDGGWTGARFAGRLPVPPGELASVALERMLEESRPDVEIVDVTLLVDGEATTVVRERHPFALAVGLRAHRHVPRADVWVKVVRADGVYIFWQSSGQVGRDLVDLEGDYEVVFDFDPNFFGSGEYAITIDVGNGFDIERNFPHSRVYDRHVDALRFTVEREWKILDLGPLNHRFDVEVRRREPGEEAGADGPVVRRSGGTPRTTPRS
jgi:lipopolysaccharide transport system ATP-binding protein